MIEFGRVAGSYGVRGWLRVVVDEPEVLARQRSWWIDGAEYPVVETKEHSGTLLAKLAGVDTPEAAQGFKGRSVRIARPAAGEGRYYWTDLIGLEVVNRKGAVLGNVKAMSSNGAHDVMEVAGERIRFLPFVPAYLVKVDLQAKRIEVDWEQDW